MDKKEVIEELKKIVKNGGDTELDHSDADALLLEYINDKEIEKAYDEIDKWYA